MLYAIIGLLVIIADQYIKFWVMGHIGVGSAGEPFIPGILSLTNVHNDGAAFGFLSGSGARIPFIILAGVFALVVIIALATKLISGRLARWSIVLVTAGGVSNCLDRVLYGYVQDMFKLEFINFPVFNLADVFITVFAIIFALAVIFGKTRPDEDEDDYEFEDEEEEEEAPRVSRRKQKRSSRRAARYEDDEEDEEEPAPVKKPARAKLPKRRQGREELTDEEEEESAPAKKPARQSPRKKAAEEALPAEPVKAPEKPAPKASAPAEDPFAAWDSANARANAARQPQQRSAAAAPAKKASSAPVQPASRPAAPSQKAVTPAQPPRPAQKPAPRPQVEAEEEEFSLDDILNEFR